MRRGARQCWLGLLLCVACDAEPSAPGGGSGGATAANAGSDAGGAPAAGKGNGGGAAQQAGAAGGKAQNGGAANGGKTGAGGAPGMSGNAGASGSAGGGVTYATDFDQAESPLSEDGAWHNTGLDWTKVATMNGSASGTQALGVVRSGPTQYNDSYAYLADFPADQQASGTAHLGSIDGSCTHEVEILLRWSDGVHEARGYECNVAFDGSYAQIVRWNGPVGDYMYLADGNVPGGVHENDVVTCSAVGDKLTLVVSGTMRATAQDATFSDGNPGMGFWRGSSGCGTLGDFGFSHFEASSVL